MGIPYRPTITVTLKGKNLNQLKDEIVSYEALGYATFVFFIHYDSTAKQFEALVTFRLPS